MCYVLTRLTCNQPPTDSAVLVLGAITFVWGIICIALTAKQFRGRKGNYTGEGTAAWIPVLLIYLIILGAWTGVTSAYTAFAVQKSWSITAGPGLVEPLSEGVRFALYQVGQTFYSSYVSPFNIQQNFSFSSISVPLATIAPWDTATTLEIANTLPLKYLKYQVLKATVICAWMTLAIVFTATVVHFALPLVLKFFGLTREDKRRKEARQLESQEYS